MVSVEFNSQWVSEINRSLYLQFKRFHYLSIQLAKTTLTAQLNYSIMTKL